MKTLFLVLKDAEISLTNNPKLNPSQDVKDRCFLTKTGTNKDVKDRCLQKEKNKQVTTSYLKKNLAYQ